MSQTHRNAKLFALILGLSAFLLIPAASAQVTTLTLDTGTETANEPTFTFRFTDSEDKACPSSCNDPNCCQQSSCKSGDAAATENLDSIGLIADAATSSKCEDCVLCNSSEPIDRSEFCGNLAELLRVALKNENMDEQSSKQVIENAMSLVEKNALAEADAKISEMKLKHEKELAAFRGQILQMSTQITTAENFKNWMGPLYTNQNRTIQQIQMLAYSANTINRTLNLLEKQMSTKVPSDSTHAKYTQPPIMQDKDSSQVYDLRRQVDELQRQLLQIQSQNVQPANHLQPIFDAQQPEPLDIPWPSEEWRNKQFRR